MSPNANRTEKSIVGVTDPTTIKRAQWEAFEFDLEAPGLIRVTNASHSEPDDHSYLVNVENGEPVACQCRAFQYNGGPCKHCVAIAIREPVLKAADEPLTADGGSTCPHDHPDCEGLESGRERPELCWECWEASQ